MRYSIFNQLGHCVNIIEWDGVTPWEQPWDHVVQPAKDSDEIYVESVEPVLDKYDELMIKLVDKGVLDAEEAGVEVVKRFGFFGRPVAKV